MTTPDPLSPIRLRESQCYSRDGTGQATADVRTLLELIDDARPYMQHESACSRLPEGTCECGLDELRERMGA